MVMYRDIKRVALWCSLAILAGPTLAASLYTETFSDGNTAGWKNQPFGEMFVTNVLAGGNPGGALVGTFFAEEPFPPFDDVFVATGLSQTANFVGDYTEVDAWVLGFDFLAANVAPSKLDVRLFAGTGTNQLVVLYTVGNTNTPVGVWRSYKLPLLAASLGDWKGDTNWFSNILTNITKVEFQVTRSDTNAQSYYLDNIFLDRVPEAVLMTDTNQLWLHMRNGAEYRYQAANELPAGSWTDLATFTASNAVYSVTVPATNDWRFYRMLMK